MNENFLFLFFEIKKLISIGFLLIKKLYIKDLLFFEIINNIH